MKVRVFVLSPHISPLCAIMQPEPPSICLHHNWVQLTCIAETTQGCFAQIRWSMHVLTVQHGSLKAVSQKQALLRVNFVDDSFLAYSNCDKATSKNHIKLRVDQTNISSY